MNRKTALTGLTVFCLCGARAWTGEIHEAARAGDAARVKAILAGDPQQLNAADNKGRTALHLAAYLGHTNIVEVLLGEGADRNVRDRNGRRPIDAADQRGRSDIVTLLIEEQVTQLGPHVFRITLSYGLRPNIGVSAGPDGVLLVDTGEARVAQRLKSAVDSLKKGPPKYIINTHPHGDHVGGNDVLGQNAAIINHGNLEQLVSQGILSRGKGPLKGRSDLAFDTYYTMRFNGEDVRLIPAPGAHTDADLLVYFTSSGVVHMGDLLLSESFPAVGDRVEKYLEILETVIDVFSADVTFIAGHGRDYTVEELEAYRAMLLESIGVVKEQVQAGKTVEQMRQEEILKEWESWGEFMRILDTDYWIQAVHDSYAVEPGA